MICDPLAHKMDLDTYDVGQHEGRCTICSAYLTYKWDYDENHFKSTLFRTFRDLNGMGNYDMATIGDYNNPLLSFGVFSNVDNDPELEEGVIIIPYTSVTIGAELPAPNKPITKSTTHPMNLTYEQLKSKYNYFGSHVDHGFPGKRSTDDQFNKAWQKIVLNDSWLKNNFSGFYNAINKRNI